MHVLVVEDNELVRAVLVDVLGEAGMQVSDTADPEQALGLLDAAGPPMVLVTDIDLGTAMDGFKLATAARRRWPSIGVVLISGRPQHLHEHRLHSRDRFLPKPFRSRDLLRTIQEIMAGTRSFRCP